MTVTINKINSQCPSCNCKTANVLAKIYLHDGTKANPKASKTWIIVKCTAKNHQYRLDPKGDNTEWKKFFK